MTPLEFFCTCLIWAMFACAIILFFDSIIDERMERKHYQKKRRPVSTDMHCPETKDQLRDVDLFYMHCFKCPLQKRKECGNKIREEMKNVFK